MKEILDLPNEVEKDVGEKKSLLSILDNYVITNDNFTKMMLLIYRIKANVPVIIMGEDGCGKKTLITKLNQILNNGEITVKIKNIHPGMTEENIYKYMRYLNAEAKNNQQNEIWAFFGELNTCSSMPLLTEIFIHRTYNGEKLSQNIRLIGSCKPYRKKLDNTEKFGFSIYDDENRLEYSVQPLPQSLLYYIFSFGPINEEDEKKYIYSILGNLFIEDEKKLHKDTRDAIYECHKFLREAYDHSVVSLRDITRFLKCVIFFQNYFTIKNEYEKEINEIEDEKNKNNKNKTKLYKIKSIICSIYICYYIRLTDEQKRINFNFRLRNVLLELVNVEENENEKEGCKKGENLLLEIKYKQLYDDLKMENICQFSDFLKIEEKFLLEQIELDKNIGKNFLLRENVFLIFLSLLTKIPLIIVGKPGSQKHLSIQLLFKSMRGIYSKNKFFQKYPPIMQTYFQGSEFTQPEDVEKLFEIAENKLKLYDKLPISMILFDEIGLADKSEANPLKALSYRLKYAGKGEEDVSFIGISNYSLSSSKVDGALYLSVPNLENRLDQLIEIAQSIVESISNGLKNVIIFEIMAKAYYHYKNFLDVIKELSVLKLFKSSNSIDIKSKYFIEIKNIKEYQNLLKRDERIKIDFHGNLDFYDLIKGTASEMIKFYELDDNEIVSIVEKHIERCFGGIDYDIDIDLDLKFADIESKIEFVSKIIKNFINNKKNKINKIQKVTSVFLFKKMYNFACGTEESYKIRERRINRYDLNECINGNINDINGRCLLIESNPSLASLIYRNIKLQNRDKTIYFYERSPFKDDINNEYWFKKINEIQKDVNTDKIIILQNFNQIHPFLYDFYNKNYVIKDEQKYARICTENFSEQLIPVNDFFRIILFVNRNFTKNASPVFLNIFEKIKITSNDLLDTYQMQLAAEMIDELNFISNINKYQSQINYSLRNLLINCKKENIAILINNFSIESKNNNIKRNKNDYKERVYKKISNVLPQDIICILSDNHIIKEIYLHENKYFDLKGYISDSDNKRYKISIIYSFNKAGFIINGIDNERRFFSSGITTEDQLKLIIDEMKKRDSINKLEKKYYILIHFEQHNSRKIKFISNFILNNYKDDNKYKYIFIVHIKRNFNRRIGKIHSIHDINPDINQLK